MLFHYAEDETATIKEGEGDLDLLKKYKELQDNSVSKEEYEKVLKEKKDIISQVLNGQTPNEEQDNRSIDDIRKVLFKENSNLTNREYVENALALREKILAEGGRDPFLPYGEKISPDDNDYMVVDRVVKSLEDCLKIANGDDDVFNVYFILYGRETIKVKGFGTVKTIKFAAKLLEGEVFKGEEDMLIWVTDDDNRIPVYFEAPLLVGKATGRMTGCEGLKHPFSSLVTRNR